MPYTPQTWVDNNASYPLSAARMNTIETGIQSSASVADQGHRILTTVQRDALTGVTAGTMIYNSTAQQMQIYIGTGWVPIGAPLVFTNEAARDAAITSPSEGMVAYLTAPTVPAATGLTTVLPTGVKTIYNGAQWVCVTEVGTASDSGTNSSAFNTSYANLTFSGTALSVTLVTGTSAMISYAASVVSSGGRYCQISVKSGTLAASNAWSAFNQSSTYVTVGRTFVMTGLTAGTNTFTLQGQANTAGDYVTSATLVAKGIA